MCECCSIANEQARIANEQARIANEQVRLSERGLFTDRLSRAVDNVSSRDLAIRLGGIDALCRMATEAQDEDYTTVMDLLCALVRMPPHRDRDSVRAALNDNLPALNAVGRGAGKAAAPVARATEFRADIQEILKKLFSRISSPLVRNNYRANLSEAELSGADLSYASLIGANLNEADLSGADLSGANLSHAGLIGANLSEANLIGANLSEVDLSKAKNLTQAQIDVACVGIFEPPPALPDGLNPPTKVCPKE